MDINEVKELINLINSSDLAYFEYKSGNEEIKMDKSLTRGFNNIKEQVKEECEEVQEKIIKEKIHTDEKDEVKKVIENKKEEKITEGKVISSPMVGTFYSSPSPESTSFVEVSQKVKKGDILCIIEAMKLMNEIESEVSGTIVEVLVKDGDMVEYGTPLFKVKED